jgi:hypothetical protein
MTSQMLAPGEAQIARREFSAEKPLAFLLFGGSSWFAILGVIV